MQTKGKALIKIARSILSRIEGKADNYAELIFVFLLLFALPAILVILDFITRKYF